MNNVKRFNYVNKILQNWETSGYTTKNEILENEKVQSKKEENISKEEEEILNYNWFDEEY
jgi:DNA replication protein DnaD